MKLITILKKDWKLFKQQVGNTKLSKWVNKGYSDSIFGLKGIIILIGIVLIAISGRIYPILYSGIWIAIPILLTIVHFLRIDINKSFRKTLIAIALFQTIGIYVNKDAIQNFVGYNSIKGYESHYETVFVQYGDYDDEHEILVYECSHWTGYLILSIFRWYFFIPLISFLPYIAWKMGQTIKET